MRLATHPRGSHIRCHFYHNQIVKERRAPLQRESLAVSSTGDTFRRLAQRPPGKASPVQPSLRHLRGSHPRATLNITTGPNAVKGQNAAPAEIFSPTRAKLPKKPHFQGLSSHPTRENSLCRGQIYAPDDCPTTSECIISSKGRRSSELLPVRRRKGDAYIFRTRPLFQMEPPTRSRFADHFLHLCPRSRVGDIGGGKASAAGLLNAVTHHAEFVDAM